MKIRLETRDGGVVGTAEIPPFNEEPNLIIWGQRLFAYHDTEGPANEVVIVYREAFAYAVTNLDLTT